MSSRTIRNHTGRLFCLLGAAFFCAVITSPLHAGVLVSNLSSSYDIGFTIEPPYITAGSFTTSAGDYDLNSVSVEVQGNDGTATCDLQLRADDSGVPGSLLESLGTNTINGGQQLLTYNSAGTLLSPSTTYWVVMGENEATVTGVPFPNWDGTFTSTVSSPVSWTIGAMTYQSANGGTIWQPVSELQGPAITSPLFSVDATSVPEPLTAAFTVFALSGMVSHRGFRRKQIRDGNIC